MNNKRFSESTCDALIGLVLRCCSTDECVNKHSLSEIASQDGVFAQWLAVTPAGSPIAEMLARDPSWRDSTPAAERLWQTANIAVRFRTLENRFVEELEVHKREAIYHFAYGLSHELNNPLANIATRAGVLAHRESNPDSRQMLETIIDNAMRGSEMLGDMMLLARPPKLNLQPVVSIKWFDTFVARCTVWAGKRKLVVESKRDLQSSSMCVDSVAFTEAGWCLVRNALEASSDGQSVQINLKECCTELSLSICDSGPGLTAKALQNCYDPYFSGREAGRGLGLGLAKAQLIAKMHGGEVKISNRPAGGCEAILTLPIHEGNSERVVHA